MFTKKNRPYFGLVLILTVLTFSFFAGCGKQEAPKQEEQAAETVKPPVDTTSQPVEEKKVLDLKGTYTGIFDSHASTLKITEQTDNKFSGSIVINYREVVNQKISGELNEEKISITMKDMLHSRYAGTYTAKLSENGKKLSGTFTQNVDKTKFSFSLNKK